MFSLDSTQISLGMTTWHGQNEAVSGRDKVVAETHESIGYDV